MTGTALVYGMAISGEAVARALHDRGVRVLVADDSLTEAKSAAAAAVGAELVVKPEGAALEQLVAVADIVCPAPGVPETHRLIEAARRHGKPIRTEIDLAYEWEQQRPGGP
ncbi:MAG: UDP-N-acetylmuramoylalanine--D-glutamate ligase, partial [Ilumatobacteraceae bacterium]|nr:UDP-N-acetylmuramoylalanine--D-glutamate ligase [Ilumatobacteraceae bacterium]